MRLWDIARKLGRWLAIILIPGGLIALAVFFLVQTYTGKYGEQAYDSAAASRAAASSYVEALEAEIEKRESRNRGLRDGSINLDLLDERARSELGMLRSDEVFMLEGAAAAQ